MSLSRIAISNFQSLRRVDLELGTFTVIVGPSSSGKSALMRAFKALASNVRGSGVITRGQKAMAITGHTETHTVTLERADRSGSYLVGGPDGTQTFTKLAGDVPQAITTALRIDPVGEGGSVNFASQFDKPYLLDESGATVARVLGELTNVTTIFAAVRGANRIRATAASTLKTRKNDLEEVKATLTGFQGLSDRLKALQRAEELDTRRQELENRIGRLGTVLRALRITERAIAKASVPEVPAADELNDAQARYFDLQARLRDLLAKQQRRQQTQDAYLVAAMDATSLADDLRDKLAEAGVCPTCGQSTS